ncbi:MAG: class I SAM-dependent methyltransferase [Acidobacteria bacterium]|nr:class I SAM-dependent methyltransferase [Acidobacteriota bacterium]
MMNLEGLTGVEKTMLLPLWGRWSESIKENGMICDTKSIELVNRMGYDFQSFEGAQHPLTRLAWITRAWNTDHELKKHAPIIPFTVICLGCGLDTAFYRNNIPLMNWVDVDLANVIDVRRQLIGDTKGVTLHAGSILEKRTFETIPTKGPVIVLALGLLCYFNKSEVKEIMNNLTSLSSNVLIIMDYFSEAGISISNKLVLADNLDAKMIWHADSPTDLLSLHSGVDIIETYPLFHKIMPLLSEQEQIAASMSDEKRINSMAVLSFTNR